MTGLIDTLWIQARHKWHIRKSPKNNSPKKHSKGTSNSSHKTQLHCSSLALPQTSGDKNQLSERLKSAGDAKNHGPETNRYSRIYSYWNNDNKTPTPIKHLTPKSKPHAFRHESLLLNPGKDSSFLKTDDDLAWLKDLMLGLLFDWGLLWLEKRPVVRPDHNG